MPAAALPALDPELGAAFSAGAALRAKKISMWIGNVPL